MVTRRGWWALLVGALGACELTEVTIPDGEPVVVVHAILRSGDPVLTVIVEEALTGRQFADDNGRVLPLESPPIPIAGARVTMTSLTGRDSTSRRVVLREDSLPGVYQHGTQFAPSVPFMPGDSVRLRVETNDGRIVVGVTRLPRLRDLAVWFGRDSTERREQFNRDRDTLRIAAVPAVGRALQLEVSADGAAPDEFAIYFFTDTMGVSFPGSLINPFEGDSGATVFRAGRVYGLSVALVDQNYYDFVRSGNDPLTGRGFINHLEGGIGVFGAMQVVQYRVDAVADVDDPHEGRYRIVGQSDHAVFRQVTGGGDVDGRWDLYLDDLEPGPGFSARIVTGSLGLAGSSIDGQFHGDTLSAALNVPAEGPTISAGIEGVWRPGGTPFLARVLADGRAVGTVTITQVSGPGGMLPLDLSRLVTASGTR